MSILFFLALLNYLGYVIGLVSGGIAIYERFFVKHRSPALDFRDLNHAEQLVAEAELAGVKGDLTSAINNLNQAIPIYERLGDEETVKSMVQQKAELARLVVVQSPVPAPTSPSPEFAASVGLLEARITRLQQIRDWLGQDSELTSLIDSVMYSRIRATQRRQFFISIAVSLTFFAAGVISSVVLERWASFLGH